MWKRKTSPPSQERADQATRRDTSKTADPKGKQWLPCAFCSERDHPSGEFRNVTSLRERASILVRNRKCMICLQRHYSSCQREKRCYVCDKYGHHQAICTKNWYVIADAGVPDLEFYGALFKKTFIPPPLGGSPRELRDVAPPRLRK
ncbi:unnamed protein product [Nippostrongylus brasiliensis]|uniref:CCHC-type domain-containing protein n=1 Tax=Nippostrongylus brasiliensis TaxID=27835 RepID=A0A0N4YP86_NIPBR|nr:hypothetical protein Q1695_000856 [Nippostrongylus brasiliensis]VDL82787.1 unnamed protein product [Nippostrongylus brasiliensis]